MARSSFRTSDSGEPDGRQRPPPSSLFYLVDAHPREQRQVVLDMPIVGDAAVRDLQQVGCDEIDRLALPLRGKYADGKSADVSNVDICADKTVDLVN
jgi:hypothetical protein